MPRLLFEKTGNAVWISHLDLMRLFQRAFKRANLPLKHTQGFNPRPSVSIALPLSVGVESRRELLDFELDGCEIDCQEIKDRLNRALVSGVKILDVYEGGRKIRELSLLKCSITMEYDQGAPDSAVDAIRNLFTLKSLILPKKTKSGMQEQDIIPMIRSLDIIQTGAGEIQMNALICCQNPTLNPAQLPLAVTMNLPAMRPDFSKCCRIEIYDNDERIFR